MHGKGECYFVNIDEQKVCYKGDFEVGHKAGYGTSYYSSGNIEYIGNWKGDLKHGYGKVYGNNNDFKYLKTDTSENVTENGQVCIKKGVFKNGKFIRKSSGQDDDYQFITESSDTDSLNSPE